MNQPTDESHEFAKVHSEIPVEVKHVSAPPTSAPRPALPSHGKPYTVLVDDNFHYMDASARTMHGQFATVEEAIAACKTIVEEYLSSAYQPGMSASQLYDSYVMFGEDPFITGLGRSELGFSAWTYAKARTIEICGQAAPSQTEQA